MNTRNVGNTETKTLYYYHTSISEGNMSPENDSQYSPGVIQDHGVIIIQKYHTFGTRVELTLTALICLIC